MHCGDFHALAGKAAGYDALFLDQVIEHPKDPGRYLATCRALLRPGGVLAIMVPAMGAIYGSLLTAWSAAALLGPLIITQLAARAKAALPPGASRVHIYDQPLAVLAALLACGLLLTLAVRPLRPVPPG